MKDKEKDCKKKHNSKKIRLIRDMTWERYFMSLDRKEFNKGFKKGYIKSCMLREDVKKPKLKTKKHKTKKNKTKTKLN
jgi:hypothetical protein